MCRSHVVADHKHVQSNGFDPQHGGTMTSMHKVYWLILQRDPHSNQPHQNQSSVDRDKLYYSLLSTSKKNILKKREKVACVKNKTAMKSQRMPYQKLRGKMLSPHHTQKALICNIQKLIDSLSLVGFVMYIFYYFAFCVCRKARKVRPWAQLFLWFFPNQSL